jgi:hypothetical protein
MVISVEIGLPGGGRQVIGVCFLLVRSWIEDHDMGIIYTYSKKCIPV